MNKHHWIWITAVFAVFAAIVTMVEFGSMNSYKKNILSSRLEGYADIIAHTDDYARTKALLPDNIRVSVINLNGDVIYDSAEPAAVMDNHLSRPEIVASLKGEDGSSIRKSETAGIEYLYYARKYGDVIVRTALPFEISQKRFLHPDWILLITIGLLFLAAVLAIILLSRRLDAETKRTTDEKLQSQKKRITGNLAHEIRTPVTSIRGYLETLINNPGLPAEKKELFTERAYLQTLRLSDMIRDIALITKIEEAPELLTREHIGVRKVTEEVFDEFASEIKERGVTIENTVPDELSVKGNQSLIYAIFRNLVENSLRYAGPGITICIESSISEGVAHFKYADNGKGVSEQYLDRIFERFYRIPEEDGHHAEGSGLGLSIVRNAVAFHGGSVNASAVIPHGLCFQFVLPIL